MRYGTTVHWFKPDLCAAGAVSAICTRYVGHRDLTCPAPYRNWALSGCKVN
jgi:hypothetical protein